MHITCFCDIQERFHRTVIEGLFQCNNEGRQWGNCYINRKVLIFFKNEQLFYANFKSYPLLLKSPEFMTLGVPKHAYSTPALKLPSLLLSHSLCNFNETTSPDQIHILRPSPLPNFSALAFHWSDLKSSIYTCCTFSMFIKIMIKMLSMSTILTITLFWATKYPAWEKSICQIPLGYITSLYLLFLSW